MKKLLLIMGLTTILSYSKAQLSNHDGNSFSMSIAANNSVILSKDIQNDFMIEILKKEGYFLFMGDLYPSVKEINYKIPMELSTFKFFGNRYYNDPENYYRIKKDIKS